MFLAPLVPGPDLGVAFVAGPGTVSGVLSEDATVLEAASFLAGGVLLFPPDLGVLILPAKIKDLNNHGTIMIAPETKIRRTGTS